MATYCSRAEHCEQDVYEKLRGCEINETEKKEILQWLVNERFVDNARYARAYVKDKFQFNKWGRKKIWMMLKAKNIDDTLISDALDEIDEQQYFAVLRDLIKSQKTRIKAKNDYDLKAKLYNFALSRGFESSLITKAISNI